MKLSLTFLSLLFCLHDKLVRGKLLIEKSPSSSVQVGNFDYILDYRLNVSITETLDVEKELKCTLRCMKKDDCFSMNVQRKTNAMFSCQFLNTSKFLFPQKMVYDNNFSHWYLKDPCMPFPCFPGGCTCSKHHYKTTGKLCDCDPDYNYALGKPAAESSTANEGASPNVAVDGSRETRLWMNGKQTCTHTTANNPKWWRVDMQARIPVARVVITNRGSSGYRLNNFEIKIGDSLENEGLLNAKCGDRHVVGEALTKAFVCHPPITGQYLVIHSHHPEVLSLCEVEVYTS